MSIAPTAPGPSTVPRSRYNVWLAVEWLLLLVWVSDAALVMLHKRAGFFTNHAADLTIPAWLYVSFRRNRRAKAMRWRRALGNLHPLALAGVFFLASAATEVSQWFWPHGLFPGTFDPADIAVYAAGLAVCCVADRLWPIPASA